MSFLNSILSSIEGGEKAPSAPSIAAPPRTNSPRTITNGTASNGIAGGAAPPPKRKAEGDTGLVSNKAPRKEVPSATARSASITAPKPAVNPPPPLTGYQGTARPIISVTTASKPTQSTSKPLNGPLSASAASAAAPKKGSFAEILARAQAAQKSAPAIGNIKHKPTEKMTRKERLLKEAEERRTKKLEARGARLGKARRSVSPEKGKATLGVTQKPKREPVDLGYKGTARPAASTTAYKGTMRPSGTASRGSASRSPAPPKPKEKIRMAGYASYSEHEDSDDEMHSDDWDDLSDMEAGAFDLEEEEMRSLRQARKDDIEEQKLENELKRKKLERKGLSSKR
ncbi:hypothetical protein NA57DRAFT_75187 [Rhizodiscina lignyota]|uniref:SPT2 chromatin protein n=1 Tax=Rhizodiscina lignyota TaxID=1504668 RepID=A0A9P4MBF2_9PEZI|nr:hypothetical protein NA57DRAFT_75187 [Rhizodiscina lignyota]